MSIAREIMRRIEKDRRGGAAVTDSSHLYADLGYDSLSFVRLILEIEEAYGIQFELVEIGMCLRIDRLIALTTKKVGESGND